MRLTVAWERLCRNLNQTPGVGLFFGSPPAEDCLRLAPRSVPVTSDEGSSLSQRYANAPAAPPSSGATQNSQSWAIAQPPTNSAGPVLRAGLTDVLVTGIETR